MIKIRKAIPEDADAIYPLIVAMKYADTEEAIKARIVSYSQLPQYCFLVAEDAGKIVAYAFAQNYQPHLRTGKQTARFHDLYVLPEIRRKGVAKQLLEGIVTWAKEQDVKWLEWNSSHDAVAFYESLGYQGTYESEHAFFEIEF